MDVLFTKEELGTKRFKVTRKRGDREPLPTLDEAKVKLIDDAIIQRYGLEEYNRTAAQRLKEEKDAEAKAVAVKEEMAANLAAEWGLLWPPLDRKGKWGRMSKECVQNRKLYAQIQTEDPSPGKGPASGNGTKGGATANTPSSREKGTKEQDQGRDEKTCVTGKNTERATQTNRLEEGEKKCPGRERGTEGDSTAGRADTPPAQPMVAEESCRTTGEGDTGSAAADL
ncbi:hypothetical protein EMCRGX_G007805 [Ephydatia muelleri]